MLCVNSLYFFMNGLWSICVNGLWNICVNGYWPRSVSTRSMVSVCARAWCASAGTAAARTHCDTLRARRDCALGHNSADSSTIINWLAHSSNLSYISSKLIKTEVKLTLKKLINYDNHLSPSADTHIELVTMIIRHIEILLSSINRQANFQFFF